MQIAELITLANDEVFRGRVKYALYKRAIALANAPGSTPAQKAVSRAALEDRIPVQRLALGVVTESAIAAAARPDAITDSQIESAVVSVVTAFI